MDSKSVTESGQVDDVSNSFMKKEKHVRIYLLISSTCVSDTLVLSIHVEHPLQMAYLYCFPIFNNSALD